VIRIVSVGISEGSTTSFTGINRVVEHTSAAGSPMPLLAERNDRLVFREEDVEALVSAVARRHETRVTAATAS
jgi:hypothetical protein